jgi:hypothetical protein
LLEEGMKELSLVRLKGTDDPDFARQVASPTATTSQYSQAFEVDSSGAMPLWADQGDTSALPSAGHQGHSEIADMWTSWMDPLATVETVQQSSEGQESMFASIDAMVRGERTEGVDIQAFLDSLGVESSDLS